jgi:phage terminase large subunit-like protein
VTTKRTPTRPRSTPPAPAPDRPPSLIELLVAEGDRATAYAADVVAGRRIAGPHVRNACRRHLDDLVKGPDRGLFWDLAAAKATLHWWEGTLKLSEGQFENKPFLLEASQAFRVASIFGWKWAATGLRRFRRFYDEEGKGNGKSPLAAGIGLKLLLADGEAGAQVYAAGAKKDQAKVLFADAVKMCRKSPALYPKRVKFAGGEGNEYNISYRRTGSFFRPISKDSGKKGSGPRPHGALADEVHEHPDRSTVEMLERGFKFRLQPLLAMFTNAGSDLKSYCAEEHLHAVRCAAGTMTPDDDFAYVGEIVDETTLAFVCALDRGDDPLTDRSCWVKANPLLGVILSEDYLAGVVAQAIQIPGKLNGILRLHFCVWTQSEHGWITREALEAVLHDFDPLTEHEGKSATIGLDLSGTADLTAMAFVVETGAAERQREDGSTILLPTYDAWIEAWTPLGTIATRARNDQAPYDVWVREEQLHGVPGDRVRFDFPASFLAGQQAHFLLRLLAYDRYAYSQFRKELDDLGLTIPEVEHPQGGRRRGKPPEELVEAAKRRGEEPPLGLWMPGSLNLLEELILDRRIRLKRNPVLVSACMSAAIDSDPLNNRWLDKQKATQRIDPAVALCMAIGAAQMGAPPPSVYETRGLRRI